ncbi:uncharacterized protein C8R40DRAFT_1168985 [Lentinula edodes]|uniref:uncharacterized protein n=1 Tax=Lentinula edodes TaxID=5353 RepID=UPI001E8D01B3|nr:uncharacterized protein C8R40DRAFT_1168985 [Lentinula edodes]KAH7877059.1 hypothetical protein C8R40DRAFT_1168985 [Lentinula edodes]
MAGDSSRSPSSGPPQPAQRSRRRASRSASVASDSGSRAPRNRRRGGGNQQRQGGGGGLPGVGGGGLPGVNEVADTATGAVGTVGDTVGGLAGGATGGGGGGGGGDKPLKLRLDLNLDVAVEIKARVHGDLTLSLLYVPSYRYHWLEENVYLNVIVQTINCKKFLAICYEKYFSLVRIFLWTITFPIDLPVHAQKIADYLNTIVFRNSIYSLFLY